MRTRNISAGALVAVTGVLGGFSPGAAVAAEKSWLCEWVPSACGSESEPGGLPGHGAVGGDQGQTRGLATEAAPDAAASAPAAPMPAKEPPAEGEPAGDKK